MSGTHPGADLGAIWHRKRSKDAFSSIWARSWSILEGFWTNLGLIFHDFLMIFNIFNITFCVLLNKSALTCFVICSKTQTLNPTNIQTTIKGKHFLLFIFQMSMFWWLRESICLLFIFQMSIFWWLRESRCLLFSKFWLAF